MADALTNEPTPTDEVFVPGEYAIPVTGDRASVERKSPPLAALQPHRDRNLKIDPRRYTGKEEAEREWQRLWPKVWICAGRTSDLPRVGSWFQFEFGGESIIIVRSTPNEISALYNVCQHRGHQLVHGESGELSNFVCGYHSWRYDLMGRNRHITDRRYFAPGALCGKLDMTRLRCETWGGNVFINMDANADPLRDYLGEVAELLDPYGLDRMHIVLDVVVDHECNWKTVLDAFSEAYHTQTVHPELMFAVEDLRLQHDFYKNGHSRQWSSAGTPSSRLHPEDINDLQRHMLTEAGLDPADFNGRPNDVRGALQKAKRQGENRWGLDYSALTDSQLTDSWVMNLFPNLQLIAMPEGFLMQRYIPDRQDPNRCRQHIMVLIPTMKPEARPPAYIGIKDDVDLTMRPQRVHVRWDDPNLKDTIGLVLWQDVETMRRCQRGMQSRGFEAIRFSEQENRNIHQFSEMDRYLSPESITPANPEKG
jgi:phenylpropionate dioxygenase-like ring-hydroxylating dioxygenase large terminal subunit